jgi:transcriptional regulator with XRE-family HTH domain
MNIKFDNLKDLLIFNIKYYRYAKGISQEKLAESCKLSPRYLTDIERGLHCPTIPKLEIISNALGIKPYELFMNNERDEEIVSKMNTGRQYNQKSNQ